MTEKAEQLQKSSMENLIEALANMNQVYEDLNVASLNASASNIISDREQEHRLEGSIRQLMVDASELKHDIGDLLDEHNSEADTSS